MSSEFTYFVNSVSEFAKREPCPANELISFLDFTSLNENETGADIDALCQQAMKHKVAAICVYPKWLPLTRQLITNSTVKIATVVNFPHGTESVIDVQAQIDDALKEGAEEIDVVIPYQEFLQNHDSKALERFVFSCKKLLPPNYALKTIIETGAFTNDKLLEQACLACLSGGADFLKTSTGKITRGASLDAAAIMLGSLQSFGEKARGLKVSGGIKTYQQANEYWALCKLIMGADWLNSNHFRIGASSLLQDLLNQ